MEIVARILSSLLLLGIAAFCGLGFLASFEPHEGNRLAWPMVYGFFGFAALFGIARNTQRLLKFR